MESGEGEGGGDGETFRWWQRWQRKLQTTAVVVEKVAVLSLGDGKSYTLKQ